jgi:hypothetical protein
LAVDLQPFCGVYKVTIAIVTGKFGWQHVDSWKRTGQTRSEALVPEVQMAKRNQARIHGLTAQDIVIADEDPEEFERLRAGV